MQELIDIIEAVRIKADIIRDITGNESISRMATDIINCTADIKDIILK